MCDKIAHFTYIYSIKWGAEDKTVGDEFTLNQISKPKSVEEFNVGN